MIAIQKLKEISLQLELSDLEQRMIIMYFIYYNTGIMVDQVVSAQINDKELFKKNLEIAKDYFKSFIIDDKS